RQTGRLPDEVEALERYAKANMMFREDSAPEPTYTDTIELDLGSVEPSVAGPKRPQDRIRLADVKTQFEADLRKPFEERGFALSDDALKKTGRLSMGSVNKDLTHGDIVIAAITSCTNTSNPSVMLAAGLVAKEAAERGRRGGQEGGGPRHAGQDLANDQPGAGLAARDGVLLRHGPHAVARAGGLLRGRLRLHDAHRQLRPPARAGGAGHPGRRHRRGPR